MSRPKNPACADSLSPIREAVVGRKRQDRSPKQQGRDRLIAAHGLRNNPKANLWITRSIRTGEELAFAGDKAHEHYYACEGDPDVGVAVYNPPSRALERDGRTYTCQFNARVEYLDGRIEYHAIGLWGESAADQAKSAAYGQAAKELGGVFRPIRTSDLDALKVRITNWRRAFRFVRAATHHPITGAINRLRVRFEATRTARWGDLVAAEPETHPSLVSAAVVTLLHDRVLLSDLDTNPLSLLTVLQLRDRK